MILRSRGKRGNELLADTRVNVEWRLPSGTILVEVAKPAGDQRVVLYARVSSHDRRADLSRQIARLTGWAMVNGFRIEQVVGEVGSGLTGVRRKLARMLSDPSARVIVVEHRGRLAGLGTAHLGAVLAGQGRRIVVVDDGETSDDVVRDMVGVLTGVCARLSGRRGARDGALAAVGAAKQPVTVQAAG